MSEEKNMFYISHAGEQLGPFEWQAIIEKVKSNEIDVTDYYWNEDNEDWQMLLNEKEISELCNKTKDYVKSNSIESLKVLKSDINVTPLDIENQEQLNTVEWFVLKGDNKFGPYLYKDVVKMLQQKALFEYDYVWYNGFKSWKRIAQISCFQPEAIEKIQSEGSFEFLKLFFRRRHKRARFNGSIIVHDNKRVWKGSTVEISAGGAGIIMENPFIMPGQSIFLHVQPADGIPPFNAVCEVVNKEYVEGATESGTPIRYGVRFLNISGETQSHLKDFANKAPKAA